MVRVPEPAAVQRARWLAELSHALEEAQMLLWHLRAEEMGSVDALDLSARLESARAEVRSLRLGRTTEEGPDFGPEWSNHPWERSEGGQP